MKCYIGDPCYILRGDAWDKLIKDHYEDGEERTHCKVNGYDCYLFNTAHGDGEFELKDGDTVVARLGVDAGMIGAVPLLALNHPLGLGLGYVADIELSADTCTSVDGNMTFGHLKVNTSWEE